MDQYAQVTIGEETDRGIERDINEDRMGSIDIPNGADGYPGRKLCVVADGMGGHAAGEVASQLAVDTITKRFAASANLSIGDALREAIKAANTEILGAAQFEGRDGMGTTVVCAVISADQLVVAHVGDSRAYLLRNGKLTALTEDHSLVSEQVKSGVITAEEAAQSANRHILSRALGKRPEVTPEVSASRTLVAGDLVLLCSDGIHGYIDRIEIENRLIQTQDQSPKAAARALIELANTKGGHDNATAIVIRVDQVAGIVRPGVARPVTQPTVRREASISESARLDATVWASSEQMDSAAVLHEQPAPPRQRHPLVVIAGGAAGIIVLCLVGMFAVTSLNRNITAGSPEPAAVSIAFGSPTSTATMAPNRAPTGTLIIRPSAEAAVIPTRFPTATGLPSPSPLPSQTPTVSPTPSLSPTTSPTATPSPTAARQSATPTTTMTPTVLPTATLVVPPATLVIPLTPPTSQSRYALKALPILPLIFDEQWSKSPAISISGLQEIKITVASDQMAIEPTKPLTVPWPIAGTTSDLRLQLVPQGSFQGTEAIDMTVRVVAAGLPIDYHFTAEPDALRTVGDQPLEVVLALESMTPFQAADLLQVGIKWNGNQESQNKFTGRVRGP